MLHSSASKGLATPEEVSSFLDQYLAQKAKQGLVIYPRAKNAQALLQMEMSAYQRDQIIEQLTIQDYYRGPREDGVITGRKYWEFGKEVKGLHIYIKLSLGLEEGAVFCYSFHPAERSISYPYK